MQGDLEKGVGHRGQPGSRREGRGCVACQRRGTT